MTALTFAPGMCSLCGLPLSDPWFGVLVPGVDGLPVEAALHVGCVSIQDRETGQWRMATVDDLRAATAPQSISIGYATRRDGGES